MFRARIFGQRILGICLTMALGALLTACLPEDKDPSPQAQQGAGQFETPSYYASGLGNIAIKIQNAVVSDASWFSGLTAGNALNLASMGITDDSMGTPIKSYICPTGAGNQVRQITWLDARDDKGKFALRGFGTDGGTIVGALRARISGNQVGIHNNGVFSMADGNSVATPASCGSMNIPQGAPLIVYDIDRPAPPTAELARTEYKTEACGKDASGRDRRGTMIQKRVVTYKPDGTITPGNWETENMGECVDDVVVQVTQQEKITGGSTSDLDNFANVSLRNILAQQLEMDCTKSRISSNTMDKDGEVRIKKSKSIDTCATVAGTGTEVIQEDDVGNGSDSRILQCSSDHVISAMRFVNLLGNGTSTTIWTSGTATLVRKVVSNTIGDPDNDIERKQWIGTDIKCRGHEDFFVACNKIPGAPALEARKSNQKWHTRDPRDSGWGDLITPIVVGGVIGAMTGIIAVAVLGAIPVFGWILLGIGALIGAFFGQTTVTGMETRVLNSDYFTGIEVVANAGTTTTRNMKADDWADALAFKPLTLPNSPWVMKNNQCLWQERVMTAECPSYDPNQQGDWISSVADGYTPQGPAALQPGIAVGGGDAADMYNQLRDAGLYVADVTIHWKKSGLFSGTKRWTETAGPGVNAYIMKSTTAQGGKTIYTTLLNREGVLKAHLPVIEQNKYLTVKQKGFVEPLRCLRNEVDTFKWPVQHVYRSCAFFEWFCDIHTINSETTITETVSREWSGKDYETGTWSQPKVGYTSEHGQWSSKREIPNPIVINSVPHVTDWTDPR